jgi:hypothetical protein
MLTLSEVVKEKARARRMGLESKFKLSIYDDMLASAEREKFYGATYFDAFKTRDEFELMCSIIKDICENDYELKRHVTNIDIDDEDLYVEVNFNLEGVN